MSTQISPGKAIVRDIPLDIILSDPAHEAIRLELTRIVAEFMEAHIIPIPRTPTKITIKNLHSPSEVYIEVVYLNGASYKGSGTHNYLNEALAAALSSAFYTPQAGPGQPVTSNGVESYSVSDHGV